MQNKINVFFYFPKSFLKMNEKYPKSFLKENKIRNACKTKIFSVLFIFLFLFSKIIFRKNVICNAK